MAIIMWQQLLRGVATDWSLFDYTVTMRSLYGSLYTTEDVYLSTYAAALSLINNGVTTVLDHCHIMNSPDNADAAVRALQDAGLCQPSDSRLRPATNDSAPCFTPALRVADAARIKEKYLSCNDPEKQRLTFGIALEEPEAQPVEETIRQLQQARDIGARIITMHVAMGPRKDHAPAFRSAIVALIQKDL